MQDFKILFSGHMILYNVDAPQTSLCQIRNKLVSEKLPSPSRAFFLSINLQSASFYNVGVLLTHQWGVCEINQTHLGLPSVPHQKVQFRGKIARIARGGSLCFLAMCFFNCPLPVAA